MKNTSNVNALGYKTAPLGLEFSVHQEKLQGAERALSSFSNSFRAFSSLALTKDWKSLRGIGSDFAQFISLIWVVLSLAAVHLPFVEITQKMLGHSFIILYNHLPIQPLAYNSSPSWRDFIVVFNQPCTLALFRARVWFWGGNLGHSYLSHFCMY